MEDKLIIDWANLPTYNTIMALFVGITLITVANAGKKILVEKKANPKSWAITLGISGIILTVTGLHMTLTWPLAAIFPFDNIIFGEPTLSLGVISSIIALYFAKSSQEIENHENPLAVITKDFSALPIVFYALGLMLISIFFAGISHTFFAAPKEEPITGVFAEYPLLEIWGLSLLFLAIGIGSILAGIFFSKGNKRENDITILDKLTYIVILVSGWAMLLFGALNYYTHIGLIVNTMK